MSRLSELLVGAVPVGSALDTVEAEYFFSVAEPLGKDAQSRFSKLLVGVIPVGFVRHS